MKSKRGFKPFRGDHELPKPKPNCSVSQQKSPNQNLKLGFGFGSNQVWIGLKPNFPSTNVTHGLPMMLTMGISKR